jgi:NDP-sugar pyrophosphorylase family protein
MNFGLIAAGEGSRLKAGGWDKPKGLAQINGEPLIKRFLDLANHYNAEKICIIVNEESPELVEYINSYESSSAIHLKVKSTPSSLHSFYEISKFSESESIFLFTVDTVFDSKEFDKFYEFSTCTQYDGVWGISNFIDDEKPLYVSLKENNLIDGFHDEGEFEYVTGGFYYMKPTLHKHLKSAVESGMERMRNFQRFLIELNHDIYGYNFSKIVDVDHIADIAKAEAFLKERNK